MIRPKACIGPGPSRLRARLAVFVSAGALAAVTFVPGAALAAQQRPHVPPAPAAVSAKAISSAAVAEVRWDALTAMQNVSGYRVWRAQAPDAVFDSVGATVGVAFRDFSAVPGRPYYYRVSALTAGGRESELSTPVGPIRSLTAENPHMSYRKGSLCLSCHALHKAATPRDILQGAGAGQAGEVAICEACHDGQGAATDVKNGPVDSFALASGHQLEESTGTTDLTNSCSSCHSPHADLSKRPALNAKRIRSHAVSRDNSWCASCHDDRNSWRPGTPPTSRPIRDVLGYPILGTFPGPTVYADPKLDAHALIPATGAGRTKGDCLICHAAHRGPNAYDGLVLTFRPVTPATVASDRVDGGYGALCLDCHSGAPVWIAAGAADVRRYVARPATESAPYAGHRVVSSVGLLPAGSPLPCYDCHNPHGSARGNASMISDELGRGLETTSAAGVRDFCLSCHSTADGRVWDSEARAFVAVGPERFEGFRRDGSDGSILRLSAAGGPAHNGGSSQSCYDCHGKDYSTGAGARNVHDPWGGALADPVGAAAAGTTKGQRERVPPSPASPSH